MGRGLHPDTQPPMGHLPFMGTRERGGHEEEVNSKL